MVRFEHVARDGTVFTFREPRKGDERTMMSYINSVIREPNSGLMLSRTVTLKDEEQWLSSRLSEIRSRSTVILLVVQGTRVLGNCHISRRPGKHAHRADIGVALRREIRGMGVGEALMRKTIEVGLRRLKGIESIHLSAFAYNDRALSLYRKLGFKEYARVPRSAKEGDMYVDEVLMSLDVVPYSADRR